MIIVKMSEIRRESVTVPGGWQAWLPEVRFAHSDEEAAYLRLLVQKGYNAREAHDYMRDQVGRVFTRGWLGGLRDAVGDAANLYQHAFGTLEGFDPERIATFYFPGDRPGRAGKGLRAELEEMHKRLPMSGEV